MNEENLDFAHTGIVLRREWFASDEAVEAAEASFRAFAEELNGVVVGREVAWTNAVLPVTPAEDRGVRFSGLSLALKKQGHEPEE